MQNVILVIHILACIALTAVVLLQRSEGGALGIGGGGPGGGLMSGRGAAGALVRTTMIFAAVFFVTSLTLTTIAARSDGLSEGERLLERELGAGAGEGGAGEADGRDPTAPLFETTPGEAPLFETPITTPGEPAPAMLDETPLASPDAAETPAPGEPATDAPTPAGPPQ